MPTINVNFKKQWTPNAIEELQNEIQKYINLIECDSFDPVRDINVLRHPILRDLF